MSEPEAWEAFVKAQKEETRIFEEMQKVFKDTPRRAEAEKIIIEKYADPFSKAKDCANRALQAWVDVAGEIEFLGEPAL